MGVVRPRVGDRDPSRRRDVLGFTVGAGDHQEHGGFEVRGQFRVDAELGRGGDVGEVGADDHHRIAARRGRVEARDDLLHRGALFGVYGVIGNAQREVRIHRFGQARGKQRQDRVGLVGVADDRAEDADAAGLAGQRRYHAESDRGLAGGGFGGGHIDAR
jgi:hypothetical protein